MKPTFSNPASRRLGRRQFLRESAALAGSALLLGPRLVAQDAPLPARPVIDAHIHLYDPTKPGGVPWPPPSNALLYSPHLPARFMDLTQKLGVVGTVVIEANAGLPDNQWVFEQAKDNPIIVAYIAHLAPGQPEFADHFEEYAKNPIFRGLRIGDGRGMGQPAFEKDIQRLAERKLTIDIIGRSSMLPNAARLAKFAPDLKIVIDHLPFPEWDGKPDAMRAALDEVAHLPNVYAKISAVPRRKDGKPITDAAYYRPGLDVLRESFGADRIVYASNWPVSDSAAPYDTMFSITADYFAGRSAVEAEKFFWKNSRAAYGWVARGQAAKLPPV